MTNGYPAILILAFLSLANASEPEALVQFFGHSGIADKRAVYTGEMLELFSDQPTLGEALPATVEAHFRKLGGSTETTNYAVLLTDGSRTQEWYAFLVKEGDVWKLSAIRNLALSGVFFGAMDQLKQKTPRTEKEEWRYQNMLLTIRSDNELKGYLKTNIKKFNLVASLYAKGNVEQAEVAAERLLISSVSNEAGVLRLTVGGVLDNSVGYLFVPEGAHLPTMSASDFIYVEEIADGWYVYKTT